MHMTEDYIRKEEEEVIGFMKKFRDSGLSFKKGSFLEEVFTRYMGEK